MNYKAWIAKSAKQPMVLESVDLGPLGAEDVEVAVEHCGVCHSDLSVFNNEWGISQYPAILGHEVVGRVTAMGPNTKGPRVGQRVGVGWYSSSCMHCHQCMSGSHHLCPQVQATIVGHRGGFATHIRAHWAWVIPLPEKLNFAEAGPLTVFAPLAMYAKPTDRVGIIGIGGLGHMAVKFAAAYGCDVLWHMGCSSSLCNSRHMNQGVLEVRLVLTRILFVAMKESDGPVEIVPTIFRVRLDEISNH